MNTTHEQQWSAQGDALDFPGLIGLDEIDVSDFPIPEQDHQNVHFSVQHHENPYNGAMQVLQHGTPDDFGTPDDWVIPMDMDTADLLVGHPAGHPSGHNSMQSYAQQVAHQVWNGNPPQLPASQMESQMGPVIYSQPDRIPPTPNSYELHGADIHLSRQRQAFMEQQVQNQLLMQQAKRDTFTPLGTPAVTPQESGMTHPSEYAIPGTYFSPLTSPALQAQNAASQYRSPHLTQGNGTLTSSSTSPASRDLDLDMFVADASVIPQERTRKPTKKAATSRSRTNLKQSPAIRAQKRKSVALSNSITAQDLENMLHEPMPQQPQSNLRANLYSTDSSGPGSISPEPLSEALMGPPPRPGSTSNLQSPTLLAQFQKPRSKLASGSAAPATPASLMSIDKSRRGSSANSSARSSVAGSGQTRAMSMEQNGLDDFELPPSAASGTATPTPETAGSLPRLAASRKTPKLGPLSTAGSSRAISTTASPLIGAMASPLSATVSTFGKDARRGSKKHGSVSGGSTLVSPALRPKISPSIKPLLPDGATLSDSQQTYLLASKSNYTHLLEGTLLPGVSYPDSLSSGLTSKRTSHKIAEQGRRNRINEALKEMQSLLPPPALRLKQSSADGSEKSDEHGSPDIDGNGVTKMEDDDGTGDNKDESPAVTKNGKDKKSKDSPKITSAASEAKAANSKAATVENAIDYIRALQKERVMLAEAMEARDSEVNELRRRLRDAEFKLGASSSSGTASTSPDAS